MSPLETRPGGSAILVNDLDARELQFGTKAGFASFEKLGSFRKKVAAGSYRFCCFGGFRRRPAGSNAWRNSIALVRLRGML